MSVLMPRFSKPFCVGFITELHVSRPASRLDNSASHTMIADSKFEELVAMTLPGFSAEASVPPPNAHPFPTRVYRQDSAGAAWSERFGSVGGFGSSGLVQPAGELSLFLNPSLIALSPFTFLNGCGSYGLPCCESTVIYGNLPHTIYYCHDGWMCDGKKCVPGPPPPPPRPCGSVGQDCCPPGQAACASPDSLCLPWLGDKGTCVPCGRIGQAACLGGPQTIFGRGLCHEGVQRNNRCVACGAPGLPCCNNIDCSGGSICSSDGNFNCVGCGNEGGPPCA